MMDGISDFWNMSEPELLAYARKLGEYCAMRAANMMPLSADEIFDTAGRCIYNDTAFSVDALKTYEPALRTAFIYGYKEKSNKIYFGRMNGSKRE